MAQAFDKLNRSLQEVCDEQGCKQLVTVLCCRLCLKLVVLGKLHCIALLHDVSQAQSNALPLIEVSALVSVFLMSSSFFIVYGCTCQGSQGRGQGYQ